MKEGRTVGIIGAGGFLGKAACRAFAGKGWQVTGFRRRPGGEVGGVGAWRDTGNMEFDGLQVILNLAGEPINKRWTDANRERFAESRSGLLRRVVDLIARMPEDRRPSVLVSASAVGIYGDRGEEILDETAASGTGYLATLCQDWEEAAKAAAQLGTRVVCLRIGLVLGREGAAWQRMRRVFRLGLGGRLGSGRQWWPWIHVEDFAGAVVHCVEDRMISGSVNVVAPESVTNAAFTRTLAAAVRRPAILPAPEFALRLVLDGFGSVLVASQRVVPKVLQQRGYAFRYPGLGKAFVDLVEDSG